jgi:hypothetical protein
MSFSKFYVNGQTGLAENWTQWFGDYFSNFVGNGFVITEDSGLDISISAGRAYIKDEDGLMFQIISSEAETLTLTDNATNYVYIHCDNGSSWLTDSTSATVPDDAMLLGVVTTDTGAITEISNVTRITPLLKSQHIKNLKEEITGFSGIYTNNNLSDISQTYTLYFNPFLDRITTIEKLKGTFVKSSNAGNYANSTTTLSIKYYIGEVETTVYNSAFTGTVNIDEVLDVTNLNISLPFYITFTISATHYGYWSNDVYYDFRAGITVSDFFISYSYQ